MINLDNKNIIPIAIGIGKRKTSLAKIIFFQGSGNFLINNKSFNQFFLGKSFQEEIIKKILLSYNLLEILDIQVIVKGGGIYSQIGAIKLALAKAIVMLNKDYKKKLKKEFFLKYDSRIKERRKYGLKKARKASQYSKR